MRNEPSPPEPRGQPREPRDSRSFTDTVGVTWTVREVVSPKMPAALLKLIGHDRRRGGWLLFESDEGEKRRLSPYPEDWDQISAFEIERWCMRASRVPPNPQRRAEDQGE